MYFILQIIPVALNVFLFIKYKIYSIGFLVFSGIIGLILYLINIIHIKKGKIKPLLAFVYPIIVLIICFSAMCVFAAITSIRISTSHLGIDMALFSVIWSLSLYITINIIHKITLWLLNKIKKYKCDSKTLHYVILIFSLLIVIFVGWYNFDIVTYMDCTVSNEGDFRYLKLNEKPDYIAEICIEIEVSNYSFRNYKDITLEFEDDNLAPEFVLDKNWDNNMPWFSSVNRFKKLAFKYYVPVSTKKYNLEEIRDKMSGIKIIVRNSGHKIGAFVID